MNKIPASVASAVLAVQMADEMSAAEGIGERWYGMCQCR
jgi:hypothetical protein